MVTPNETQNADSAIQEPSNNIIIFNENSKTSQSDYTNEPELTLLDLMNTNENAKNKSQIKQANQQVNIDPKRHYYYFLNTVINFFIQKKCLANDIEMKEESNTSDEITSKKSKSVKTKSSSNELSRIDSSSIETSSIKLSSTDISRKSLPMEDPFNSLENENLEVMIK